MKELEAQFRLASSRTIERIGAVSGGQRAIIRFGHRGAAAKSSR